jgi:glycosyltransferase involved in cell wall biosynthesis
MNIAYLMNIYPMTSTVFIRREILALERRGIQVTRIALRGWNDEPVDQEDKIERERTRYVLREGAPALLVAILRMLATRPLRLLNALGMVWRVGRRADRPLLVHLVYLAEACRVATWLRAAGIQHLHAHFGTNSAEVAMLAHILGGPQWSFTIHGPEEFVKPRFIGLADKIRDCAFVVAISSFGRSQLYRLLKHQHWQKVKIVHCGLEPSFFSVSASPPPVARRLVCVGRLCEQKGQLLLIEATRRLAAAGVDFQLALVGDGEMRADIEALIRRYKLQAMIRITGRISSDKLHEEILAARALILPSFAEGLPMVIMEAMALRRPVISTFVAGIPELVHTGEHGWLVPAGDVEALMEAMEACLEAPAEMLASMGEAANKRAFGRHNVEIQAAQLSTLFQAAIEGEIHEHPVAGLVTAK